MQMKDFHSPSEENPPTTPPPTGELQKSIYLLLEMVKEQVSEEEYLDFVITVAGQTADGVFWKICFDAGFTKEEVLTHIAIRKEENDQMDAHGA
jgi:hypothetical protein